jgi:hypothetical protein
MRLSVMASPVKARSAHDDIVRKLIGAWRLVSWSEIKQDGGTDYPLGKDAIGQLIYSADGHVAAQLARKDLPPLRDEDWRSASQPESAQAWKSYFGYFGTFSIDTRQQAVIHHVEGSWFPNLSHTDQTRLFRFVGDELVLDADTAWGKVVIVWEKAPDRSADI